MSKFGENISIKYQQEFTYECLAALVDIVASRARVVRANRRRCVSLQKLSRGVLRLVTRPQRSPASLFVIFWTASVEPALSFSTPRLSLLQEPSTAVIRVHRRGSDLSPVLGVYVTVRSSVFYVYLLPLLFSLPTLPQQEPRVLASAGPLCPAEPQPQLEQQGFSSALTHLLAMTSDDNHSLHADTLIGQPSVHVTLQQNIG